MYKDASHRTLSAKENEYVRGLLLEGEAEPWLARWVRCPKSPQRLRLPASCVPSSSSSSSAQSPPQPLAAPGASPAVSAPSAALPSSLPSVPASSPSVSLLQQATAAAGAGQATHDPRILVVTHYRVFLVKRRQLTGSLTACVNVPLYDLECAELCEDEAALRFRDGPEATVSDRGVGADLALALGRAFADVCHAFPPERVPELRLRLKNPVLVPPIEPGIAGHFVRVYSAWCDYFDTAPSDLVGEWVQELVDEGTRSPRGEGLSTCDVQPLLYALKHNHYWRSVSLRHAPPVTAGIASQDLALCLASALSSNRTLSSVTWCGAGLSPASMAGIEKACELNSASALTSLDLSHNRLGQAEVATLASALAQLKAGLRSLSLRGVGLQTQLLDGLLDAVAGPQLTHLDISQNELGQPGVSALIAWIRDRSLLDSASPAPGEPPQSPPKPFGNALESLGVAYTGATADYIVALLELPALGSLRSLDISGTAFDNEFNCDSVSKLIAARKCVCSLKMNDCKLTVMGALSVLTEATRGRSPQSESVRVELCNNNLGMAGASAVGRVLSSSAARINSLAVAGNAFGPDGLIALIDAVCKNRTLTELDIGRNVSRLQSGANSPALKKLATRLGEMATSSHATVVSLGISGCPKGQLVFGPDISPFLSTAADAAFKLQKLDLSGNSITDGEMAKFFGTLSLNSSLTELNLADNQIGMNTIQALSTCLLYNHTLAKVPLPPAEVNEMLHGRKAKVAAVTEFLLADHDRRQKLRRDALVMIRQIGERLQANVTKRRSPEADETLRIVRTLSEKSIAGAAAPKSPRAPATSKAAAVPCAQGAHRAVDSPPCSPGSAPPYAMNANHSAAKTPCGAASTTIPTALLEAAGERKSMPRISLNVLATMASAEPEDDGAEAPAVTVTAASAASAAAADTAEKRASRDSDDLPPPPPMYEPDSVMRVRGVSILRDRRLVRKSLSRSNAAETMALIGIAPEVVPLIPPASFEAAAGSRATYGGRGAEKIVS
eukprot:m51a1_g1483 hypothetical protein (1013) ;mRNA; f:290922-294815